ncbi:MAG: class GN sortase [Sphingomonadales bacterium]
MIRALLGSGWTRVVAAPLALIFFGLGFWFLGGGLYIAAKAEVAQILLERAFDKTLETGENQKPWGWADTWPVAKISFPALGKEAIVLDKTSGQALAFGPGLMPGLSEIGHPGTAIIAAHNDTHFAFLEDIKIGQTFEVQTWEGAVLEFEVVALVVIDTRKPLTLEYRGISHLILSTCFPFKALASQTPFRFLVTSRLVLN